MRAYVTLIAKQDTQKLLEAIPKDKLHRAMETYGMYDGIAEIRIPDSPQALSSLFSEVVNKINKAGGKCTTYAPAYERDEKGLPDIGKRHVYSFIDCDSTRMIEVQQSIIQIEDVNKADIVYGPFDIIADLVVKDMADLRRVTVQIERLDSVVRVSTLVPCVGL